MYTDDCILIDQFLAADKFLAGLMPEWHNSFGSSLQTRWPIVDSNGGTLQAELCLSVDSGLLRPSISVLLAKKLLYRIDLVPAQEEKPNPHWAAQIGLPAKVIGSHTHPWDENRVFCENHGFGELPCRKPVAASLRNLRQALAQTASDINISVTPEQSAIDLPPEPMLLH